MDVPLEYTSEQVVTLEAQDGAVVATLAAQGPDPAGSGALAWREVAATHSLLTKSRGFVVPMLNDVDRNTKFEAAIKAAVRDASASGDVRCFDIGAGTGLLSMLAARHGAKDVHAIEQFPAMAELARATVAENGLSDCITVHTVHTDALGALEPAARAQIVVSEVLDSQLLHEGVNAALRSARAKLLRPGGVCIPERGEVWGVLVGGPAVRALLRPTVRAWGACAVRRRGDDDDGGSACCGDSSRAIPIRLMEGLSPLPRVLSAPFRCCALAFGEPGEGPRTVHTRDATVQLRPDDAGAVRAADAVLVWWKVQLYGDITISTEPAWADVAAAAAAAGGAPRTAEYQDHWLPCLLPLPSALPVPPVGGAATATTGEFLFTVTLYTNLAYSLTRSP